MQVNGGRRENEDAFKEWAVVALADRSSLFSCQGSIIPVWAKRNEPVRGDVNARVTQMSRVEKVMRWQTNKGT